MFHHSHRGHRRTLRSTAACMALLTRSRSAWARLASRVGREKVSFPIEMVKAEGIRCITGRAVTYKRASQQEGEPMVVLLDERREDGSSLKMTADLDATADSVSKAMTSDQSRRLLVQTVNT